MKVIHLISGGDTGGAKTHVHSLLQNLSRGMDITLVCFRDGPFAREAAELGIETRVCSGGFFSALREVRRMIAEEGFELVHTHGSRANLAGAILRSTCGRPVVSTIHSDYRLDYMGRPLAAATYGVLNVLALRRIKYHVGVSDAMRDLLISRRFPRETTFAIYNGLDFSREPKRHDRAAFCARVGANVAPGDIVVGAAARLDPVKDLATLVRGFAAAREGHPELKLIIAGEGPERPALEALAEELGVRGAVTLAGWLDDMEEFYSALDINSLSSLSETFPYALTEGAAYRLPTVASAVGGIPRLIEDGKTGFLFAPGDWEKLGARLAQLASDPGLRERLGAAVHERAAREFSVEATCREQRAVYEEILEREARGRSGVVICGAYGMGNSGDEAILDAIVAEMRAIDPLMPLTVMTRDPAGASARLGLTAVHTFNFPRFLAVMRRRALYINGGGSLIQDVTSRRSLWYYLFTLRAAKRLGCKVMMYGCGIGPVKRPGGVERTRRVLNSCVDAITLREPDSIEELARFGVTKPEIILASDPALTLPSAPAEEVDAALEAAGAASKGKYICFALRLWPGFGEKAGVFAAAARHAHEAYGLTPVFLPINHLDDGQAAALVAEKLGDTPHVLLPGPMSSALVIGLMSRMQVVVSMRLHGLIFAAGQGVPLIGVSYDPKVTAFLRCVDAGCVPLEGLEEGELCRLIDGAAARSGDAAALEENVRKLRAIEHRSMETAARLLGKEVQGC
ncbi:MAG TPA: polysaccharide pyruvyl transferase CsaB [Candidatus Scatomorpha intestinigallinarum]|uniref:Polysaccharide pyruvyl transferase CsaB n=1 Tax=Candidatus Scatomorpha intestinigallinarum TaxID=2840923 RepID=A0A9D1DJX4_9FIRM|nr:polysaccharide pyruvyl transferase CsaB [Candidatus Scatomorpha intestinigallinarum]